MTTISMNFETTLLIVLFIHKINCEIWFSIFQMDNLLKILIHWKQFTEKKLSKKQFRLIKYGKYKSTKLLSKGIIIIVLAFMKIWI